MRGGKGRGGQSSNDHYVSHHTKPTLSEAHTNTHTKILLTGTSDVYKQASLTSKQKNFITLVVSKENYWIKRHYVLHGKNCEKMCPM